MWGPRRRLGRLLGILGREHLPQPLLGFLAGRNGVIALLLGLLPTVSLDRQFVPRPLEGLFHKLPLAVRTQDRLALASLSWANSVWRSWIVA